MLLKIKLLCKGLDSMEKKVGNCLLVFLLFFIDNIIASDATISLSMQNMNHEPIRQAMCKAPFILQVELKNLEGYSDLHLMQNIAGIENFKSSRSMTSQNVSIDNGKKTIKTMYNFVLRSDKKGTFTIGPVFLKSRSGNACRSNKLIIYVGDELLLSEKVQKDKYFITIELDKKQAYVGEKVNLTIKFYDRLLVDDLHLQFPEFKDVHILKSKNGLKKSIINIEEEEYSVSEWNFDMYPAGKGSLILQGIQAAFFAPELESKFKFGGAFDFFRSLHKSEQYVVAHPVKVDVVPLPKSNEFSDVIAVGQFSEYSMKINQDSVPAGQGVVLTVELFGDANFEMIPSPQLILPDNFKYYDSNMVVIDPKRNSKRFEFIVQADEPGFYRIKAQSLIYFDPVALKYKKILSNGFDITITPALNENITQKTLHDLDIIDHTHEPSSKELKDFKIIDKGAIYQPILIMVPTGLYQKILWLLLLIWLGMIFYSFYFKKYIVGHRLWIRFLVFYQAEKSYKKAVSQQNIKQLPTLFNRLLSGLIDIHINKLNEVIVLNYFKNKNFSDEELQNWKVFQEQILRATFSFDNYEQKQKLFEHALQWIKKLKEKA